MRAEGSNAAARALDLAKLFHRDTERLASFTSARIGDLPEGPRTLLAHSSHMTLAMERFHHGPVSLTVVDRRDCPDGRYAREILLHGPDGRIVQYGIVRIDLHCVPYDAAAAIRAESTPLGRILTSAGLLCDVHDVELLRVEPGADLVATLGSEAAISTFGRVATIEVEGRPLIELLEIVAPGTA